jgi:hypothetical protein
MVFVDGRFRSLGAMKIARALRVAIPKRAFVRALRRHYASVSELQRPLDSEDKEEFYKVSHQLVKQAAPGRRDFANQEVSAFSTPEEDETASDSEKDSPNTFIKPGSFVELRRYDCLTC